MHSVLLIGFGAALGAAATYYLLSEHLAAKVLTKIQGGLQSAAYGAGTAAKKL